MCSTTITPPYIDDINFLLVDIIAKHRALDKK